MSASEEKTLHQSADASLSGAADEIAQYLKDGETVVECIARNRADTDAVLTLLAREKRRSKLLYDALQTVMRYAPGYDWNADDEKLTLVTGEAFQAYEQYFALSGAASTPALEDWDAILAEADRYLGGEPLPGTTKPLYDALRKVVSYVKAVRQSPPVPVEDNDSGAGLIGQVASPLAGTEPRPHK